MTPPSSSPRKPLPNPFYVVLVLTGMAFAVTACAYGVMTLKESHISQQLVVPTNTDRGFVDFVNRHGFRTMMVELAILGVATLGAIGTDSYWSGESAASSSSHHPKEGSQER